HMHGSLVERRSDYALNAAFPGQRAGGGDKSHRTCPRIGMQLAKGDMAKIRASLHDFDQAWMVRRLLRTFHHTHTVFVLTQGSHRLAQSSRIADDEQAGALTQFMVIHQHLGRDLWPDSCNIAKRHSKCGNGSIL